MADIQSNIQVNIDTSEALASIKLLQKQISAFHSSMAKSGAAAAAVSANMQQNLINSLNATGKFSASMRNVKTTTESFTNALEKNKLSMREYFRYSMGATRTFGSFFKTEFDTINKVARERVKDLQTQYIKMGRDANGAMKAIAVRPLALDMNNLGTQTAMAAQRQALLNQLLKQGSTNMLNFGKNTQWAGRQLMVGFTIPLMYLGSTAAKTFMQLEEQAIRFKRVYGELFTTSQETDKMLKDIQLLAKEYTKYGVTVEETMKMAADAAAMGKMGADLLAQINEATRLAVLGGVEQEQALETTISLTNAFGVEAEALAKKIDFLNSVENQTVVSIEDLTIAIPKAGPVIQQLGGDVEDLAFFLTAMKEGGINASEGANALKSGLASLINPTEKAAAFLGDMGVNIKGIVEANKGDVKGIVIDFANALNTLDPLNRARAIEQLFGKFQFARLSTLFQNVIQEGNQASRVLKLTQATTEELAILSERELARVEESTTYRFKKTIEDLKVTLAPVGEQFLKAVTPIIEFVTKILDKFNNLSDGAKKFVVIMTTVLGAIGPVLLMTFGLLANGVANIIRLFTTIKGVFNRAGQSSAVLGNQTQFLTTEQAQAAAVASSLNQIHTTLNQTFTSEASALNALTAAYQRAIAAQRGFGGPTLGPAGKIRKFAKGTENFRMVGGTGNQDSELIYAMPGEAIIPTKIVQKYPDVISALVNDNIPKNADGRLGSAKGFKNATIFLPESINTVMGGSGPGARTGDVTSYLKGAGRAAMAPLMAVMAREIKLGLNNPKYIQDWRVLGDQFVLNATTALEQSGRKFITDSDFEEIVVPAMRKAAAEVTIAGKQVGTAFDNAVNQIRTVGPVGVGSGSAGGAGRTGLQGSYRGSRSVAQTFATTENPSFFRKEERFSQSKNRIVKSFKTLNPALQRWEVGTMAHITKSVTLSVQDLINKVRPYLGEQGERIVRAVTQSTVNGIKVAAKVASPSKETQRVGAEIGRGAIIGVQSFVDDAKAAGQQLGSATVQGTQSQKAAASRAALYGTGPIDPQQKSLRRQLQRQARIEQLAQKRLLTQAQITGMVASGAGGSDGPGSRGGFFGRFRKPAGQDPDGFGGRRGIGVGGAAMGLSMAAMAGSMAPGKVGEISQKLMMPLMLLATIGPMIANPMGALVIALGAFAAGIVKLRMEFDKAQDSSMKLRESITASRDSMRSLSKFAGTVTAGEIMDRRRQNQFGILGTKPGKTTFGEAYVQSKEGKAVMDAATESIKARGVQATSSDMANQLASSVISGAITSDQAKSIALNIGKKLGNYGLGFSVTAKITELIGPNGEKLEKEPLQVRLKLIQEQEKRSADVFKNLQQKSSAYNLGVGAADPRMAVAGGALAGAAAGAIIGSAVPVIGTAIGALVGTGAGYLASRTGNEKIANLSGATVASQKTQMEQQKEMVDSLDLYYQKKIQELTIEGKITKAKELQRDYDRDRNALIAKGAELSKGIMTNYASTRGNVRSAMDTGIDKLLSQRYKGTDELSYLGAAKELIKDSGLTAEQQYLIKVKMSTGELSPSQQVFLFSNFGEDKDTISKYMDILANFSATTAEGATQVMNMFVGPDGKPLKKMQSKFIAQVSTAKTDKEASKLVGFFAEVANTNGVFDMSAIIKYYLENPEIGQQTQGILDNIEKNKGKLTLDVMTNFLPENVMGAIDVDYFNKLSQDERLIYTKEIATIVNIPDPVLQKSKDFIKWQKEGAMYNGQSYANKSIGAQLEAYRKFMPEKVTEAAIAQGATTPPTSSSGDGSKKADSSPLDELVRKLRDVRKNQIKVTEGWSASMKTLDQLFGGKKKIDIFGGIEQDLAKLGAKGNFIELIIGMDPKEYEKRKNQLFKFDNKGNIVALKRDAKSIQEALNSIVAGDFQSSLVIQQQQLKDQTKAYNILRQAGVGVAQAHELIADAAFAAFIATEGNGKSAQKLLDLYKKVNEQKKLNELKTTARTDKEAADALSRARANVTAQAAKEGWDWRYADAILNDDTLRAFAELNKFGSKDFKDRLQQVLDSIEFKESIFNKGFEKAMEKFSAMETKIELDFQFATLKDQDVIEKAQDKIAGLQYEIDDWEAGLKDIEDQEQKINDKYDAKFKALDEIRSINERISRQQKGQLTLADALSQGDIAAAARAAQDIRAQEASDAIDAQQKSLEAAKENDLANVRNSLGYTRAQIEQQVKSLRDEIFKIEEKELEPAQERVRIEEAKKRELLQSLTVLGRSKLEWEQIKNRIDLAKTSSAEYMQAIQAALDVVDSIVKYWNSLDGKVITTTHKIITIYEGGSGDKKDDSGDKKDDTGDKKDDTGDGSKDWIDPGSFRKKDEDTGTDLKTGPIINNKSTNIPTGFTQTPNVPYKTTWQSITDPVARAHVKDMETNISANIAENSKLFAQNIAVKKATENAGAVAGMHLAELNKMGNALALAQKYAGPEAAKKQAEAIQKSKEVKAAQEKAAADIKKFGGNAIAASQFANWKSGKASGGLIKRFATGGPVIGTDVVPAMLTPGEFIMSRYAVENYGVDRMKAINNGDLPDSSVYNYSIAVNVRSDANPDEIARAVMGQIKQVDSKRLRGGRI